MPLGPTAWAALRAEQLAIAGRTQQLAVAVAQERLTSMQGALAASLSALSLDRQRAADDASALVGHQVASAADADNLGAAGQARQVAAARLARDRVHLVGIGVSLYAGGTAVDPAPGGDGVSAAQQEQFVVEMVTVITDTVTARVRDDGASLIAATDHQRRAADNVHHDATQVSQAAVAAGQAAQALTAAQATVTATQTALASAQGTLASAQQALNATAVAMAGPDQGGAETLTDDSPTILGPAALTDADLAAWFDAAGEEDLTATPINQLASWYISEGVAEGVRGDIAFAQAVVETGGFSSSDAISLNNYAGIGHCDSCGAGLAFPSPQAGIRAQMQLLHTYADPTLTTGQLAEPLVEASLAPETQAARGCCASWGSLTGRWASDPRYEITVLTVYEQMLDFALTAPQAATTTTAMSTATVTTATG